MEISERSNIKQENKGKHYRDSTIQIEHMVHLAECQLAQKQHQDQVVHILLLLLHEHCASSPPPLPVSTNELVISDDQN